MALLNQVMSSTLQINKQQLSIVSYNCSGFKHSRDYINTFLAASKCMILCLQETWLLETNMDLLSTSHADYLYTGVSGVEVRGDILQGQPNGGNVILWHKSISDKVSVVQTGHKRLCSVEICVNKNCSILLISVTIEMYLIIMMNS